MKGDFFLFDEFPHVFVHDGRKRDTKPLCRHLRGFLKLFISLKYNGRLHILKYIS